MYEHLLLQLRLRVSPYSPLLLALELVVKQEERLLVCLRGTNDGEHPLSSVIVRSFGDRNLRAGQSADLSDLCAAATNDTANHVRRDGNVLSTEVRGLRRGCCCTVLGR